MVSSYGSLILVVLHIIITSGAFLYWLIVIFAMVLKRFLHNAKKAITNGQANDDWLDSELRGSKGLASVGKEGSSDSFSSFKKRKPGKLGAGEDPNAEIDDIDDLMV